MKRILLAVAGYAITAWWNGRKDAKAEARAERDIRPERTRRKSAQLQGHGGERRQRSV